MKKKRHKSNPIGEKIAVLKREGKTTSQAAGEAYGMQREGRLRSGGRYIHVGRSGRHKGRRSA